MKSWKGLLLTIIISLTFLFTFYGKILSSPNTVLFTAGGDGIKNYYTYAYHIKNDSSLNHFEGMNYPYGELVVYTDGHYALANSIKLLSSYFPGIIEYSIGILNFTMIAAFLLCAIFLYLILVHYGVNQWISGIAAFSIFMLAPQIERLEGHLSLSYSFFIPLTWFLFLKLKEGKRIALLFLGLLQLGLLFTHPYMGVISVFMTVLFAVIFYFKKWKKMFALLMVSGGTVVFFQLFVKLIDTHTNRPGTPSGFFHYCAQIGSVFQPHAKPFYNLWYHTVGEPKQRWEGWSYIGMGALLMVLYLLFTGIKRLVKERKVSALPKEYQYVLLVGVLGLFYSYGFPYRQGLSFLLDLFPFIKQIRVLGRFAWVFYFLITVMTFVIINYKVKSNKLKYSMLLTVVVLNVWESYAYHSDRQEKLSRSSNLFIESEGYQIDVDQYQAILPLPYYYIGNENIQIPKSHSVFNSSLMLSYHNNIPLMSNCLSRSSNDDVKNIVSLFSPIQESKEVLKKLNDKKVLIVKGKGELTKYELDLLSASEHLNTKDDLYFYELDLQEYMKRSIEIGSDSLVQSTLRNIVSFNDFDTLNSTGIGLNGAGYSGMKKSYNVFYESSHSSKDSLNISLWYYVGEENLNENMLIVEEIDTISGKSEWTHVSGVSKTFVTIGDWQLVEMAYEPSAWVNKIKVFTRAYTRDDQEFFLDNFLIQKRGEDVYQKTKEGYWLNNLPLFNVDSSFTSIL